MDQLLEAEDVTPVWKLKFAMSNHVLQTVYKPNGLFGANVALLVDLVFKPELVKLLLNHQSEELHVEPLLNKLNVRRLNVQWIA